MIEEIGYIPFMGPCSGSVDFGVAVWEIFLRLRWCLRPRTASFSAWVTTLARTSTALCTGATSGGNCCHLWIQVGIS